MHERIYNFLGFVFVDPLIVTVKPIAFDILLDSKNSFSNQKYFDTTDGTGTYFIYQFFKYEIFVLGYQVSINSGLCLAFQGSSYISFSDIRTNNWPDKESNRQFQFWQHSNLLFFVGTLLLLFSNHHQPHHEILLRHRKNFRTVSQHNLFLFRTILFMSQKYKRCHNVHHQTFGNLTLVVFTKFSVKTARVSVSIQYKTKLAR